MRNLRWICWYLWEGLPTLLAFPIDSSKTPGNGDFWSSQWEVHWSRYAIGTLGFVVVAFTLAGCLCCRRQRRPKGFQDDAGTGKEFKDGSTAGTETTIERVPSSSLELEVPRILTSSSEKIQFDEISCNYVDTRSTIKPPSSSLYNEYDDDDAANSSRDRPCNEWYEGENFPREKLKYLREIGRGWFGKVVEGTTLNDDEKIEKLVKNRGVVVRILTEGATMREKSWFLGESTPYLKLRHSNILQLLGFCLESDPYLLLFESCPSGDLKNFLITNRSNSETLRKENLPTRMALNIANALEHMHDNGFAHTDLSARNCLVGADLTAKLGDYGIGVEKYPLDYYVVGDRALPIRWSAPESLVCTETTIETRAITPQANIWSYGVLLWEIANWAERPYDDLGDEQVIEMIFSINDENSMILLKKLIVNSVLPTNFRDALESTWKFLPSERSSLAELREILCGKRIVNFEKRWETLKPNGASSSVDKSASLQDLRGSLDSGLWQATSSNDKNSLRANFRLGPDEPVINCPSLLENSCHAAAESGSETEEESWRGRVERGVYTEKVKQKSKSVADLMILVHIDSDSDVETSLVTQNIDKNVKKRLPPSGSDGDLRSAVIADEFDEALRKLRDPSINNSTNARITQNIVENLTNNEDITENINNDESIVDNSKICEYIEKPKLLTLTNQGKTPILRLSFGTPGQIANNSENLESQKYDENCTKKQEEQKIVEKTLNISPEISRNEQHVLRLVSKGNPDLPLLRYFPDRTSTPINHTENNPSVDCFLVHETSSDNLSSSRSEENGVDVELWNDALAHELEKKNPAYVENSTIFDVSIEPKTNYFDDTSMITLVKEDFPEKLGKSVPNTPKSLQNFPTFSYHDRDNVSGSSSAPETPQRNYLQLSPKRSILDTKKITKNVNYYQEDEDMIMGSSSAPETPFRDNYKLSDNDDDSSNCEYLEERINMKDSAPDTPQSRGNYSVGNVDEDLSSTVEELENGMLKRTSHDIDDEEDRKHLSTPDDERSSDSGFRDKESCEEEESPIPGPQTSSIILGVKTSSINPGNSSPLSASAEEEQMRILFELDTILDAEYYGNFRDSDKIDENLVSLENMRINFDDSGDDIAEKIRSISESHDSTESTEIFKTVRANSCEGNFLDTFYEKNDESKYELLNDENFIDHLENTEADSMSDFVKIEETTSKREDFVIGDSSSESPIKSDKNPSNDSSLELARLNLDSSSSREKHDTTDFTIGTRSDFTKNETTSEISSMKTDRNSSTYLSLELRVETSDSTSSSGKIDRRNLSRDEISEIREETKDDSSVTIDKMNRTKILDDDTSKIDDEMKKSSISCIERDRGNFHDDDTRKKRSEEEEDSTRSVEKIVHENILENDETTENFASSMGTIDRETFSRDDTWEIQDETENSTSSAVITDLGNNFSLADASEIRRETENLTNSLGETDTRNFPLDDLLGNFEDKENPEEKENSTSSNGKIDRRVRISENPDDMENSSIESPLKIDDNRDSDLSVDGQRDGANSDVEQWSSRENIDEIRDEEEEEEEDSSTMSLRSDNSYVSFGLDEEFVAAIRNELREKLPRAQMPVVEALDPHDEKETTSINAETTAKSWADDDDVDENSERSSVDISIRYNIYGTPLSPIMEERESAGTSESMVSKEDSGDASIASRVSALSEDLLVVDTRTNRAIIVEAGANGCNAEISSSQHDEDRDTSQGDFSDEENLEYPQNSLNRGLESRRIIMATGGAPLPSPEEESKWQQQFPLPLHMQDDLMSTSFGTDRDCDSQDDEEGEDEGHEGEEGEEDEEDDSSSSGEFVWKCFDGSHGDLQNVTTRSPPNKPKSQEREYESEEDDVTDDEEEEEFTPSAWDAKLEPKKSALKSPEKNLMSARKSVAFKKQRYHCVYEYPKESSVFEGQGQKATTWEPTSYSDWEEMMDEPRPDVYPMEYDETNRAGDEEFYVSSSNRPFQFQSGEGKYVSQFFPGASTSLLQHENQHQMSSSSSREADVLKSSQDEVDRPDNKSPTVESSKTNESARGTEFIDKQEQKQLGKLRHTRDRLKLNLLSTGGSTRMDEEGNENRTGDCENIEKIEEKPEKTDNVDAGKTKENSEKTEIPKNIEENTGGTKKNIVSIEEIVEITENLEKLKDEKTEVSAENIEENAGIIEENPVKMNEDSEKIAITSERSSNDDKFDGNEEIAEASDQIDSKIDIVGESSIRQNIDNLAVNETSKIENDEEKKKGAFFIDNEKQTIDTRDNDNKLKESEESKNFHEDVKIQEVGSTRVDSANFGDQKQESSSSRVKNCEIMGELLEIPKLQTDESRPLNIDENTNSAIVVNETTNNSSKNGENIGDIENTEMVQSSSQS